MSEVINQIEELSKFGFCDIVPCDNIPAIDTSQTMKLNPQQTAQISSFVSHIPELMSASALSNAYTVSFPKGVQGSLMQYKSGGVSSSIVNKNGKIIDHASFHKISNAMVLTQAAFSVMALASSQYYLTQMHNELKMLNQRIDAILSFLYGDKKAELMSEICFVQQTYDNFSSIMQHDEQRIATITNLQAAQKVAMKDVEFYLQDLKEKSDKSVKTYSEFEKRISDAFMIKDSLEISAQLYAMANVMSVFYSQNYDEDYINNLEENVIYYVNKCNKQILSDFSKLYTANNAFKSNKLIKTDTVPIAQKLQQVIQSLNDGDDAQLSKIVKSTLNSIFSESEFVFTKNGTVYKIK